MIYYKGRQIDEINAYNVEGTTLNNQSKEIEINKNGETIITYDEGYTGLEQVTVNVNVASQGGEGGNLFETIGYPETPQYIQDGIEYAKTIQNNWDASITNRHNAFSDDTQLVYFPLVDTSNVTNMSIMFSGCTNLQYVPSFDTSKVTNMRQMFYKCNKLTSLDLSSFNTSKVTSMSYMFSNCGGLTSLDLSNFVTSKVTDMSYMFNGCSSLKSLNVSSFDTSNVTNMSNMFSSCSGLTSLDLSSFDTSAVTSMNYMFNYCSGFTSLDLSSFNTSKVTSMNSMFYYCYKLQRIDGFIDWTKISSYPSSFIYSSSSYGYPLRYMTIKNLGTTGTTFNFNNTHLQNWGDESDTTTYPLSVGARQSLVDTLLTYSYDRAANGLSNATIQLQSKVKARLTADEITAIQNKGYTIS